MENKDNRKGRIRRRYSLLLIALGLIIMIVTISIGLYKFSDDIEKLYFHEGYGIAHLLKKEMNLGEIENSFNEIKEGYINGNLKEVQDRIHQSQEYQMVNEQMTDVKDSLDCSGILLYQIDDSLKDYYAVSQEMQGKSVSQRAQELLQEKTTHIAILYASKLEEDGKQEEIPLGSLIIVDGAETDKELTMLSESKSTDHAMLINTDTNMSSGYSTKIIETLEALRIGDKNIGYLSVQIPAEILARSRASYLFYVGILTVVIIFIFLFIYHYISNRYMFKPLETITHEASTFVENNNHSSENLTKIKTRDEIEILAQSLLKLENDLKNYIEDLTKMTSERERIQTELDLAANIQMNMLPQEFPAFPERNEFEVYASMRPAKEVGGDFYDYFLIDDDHLGFLIGDVSGKGVPAALFMANAKTLINAIAHTDAEADEIYNSVNDYLVNNNGGMLFITSWFGIYEISTGTLKFINAGHESPVLFHKDGSYEEVVTKPNLALAVMDGIPYRLNEMKLEPGDKLFLVTDGVTEAQNIREEFFGKEQLIQSIESVKEKSIEEIIKKIRNDIDIFAGEAEQFDDITLVGLYISEKE